MAAVTKIALVFALLLPGYAPAQTGVPGAPRAGLTISVRDGEGRGIAAATVVVTDALGRVLDSKPTTVGEDT